MKLRSILMPVFYLALTTAALAQVSVNGSLRGRITDVDGAAVASASLELTNADTNAALTATTGGEGQYVFVRVAPGRYTLTVERDGFKRAVREGVVVTVNEASVADLTLAVSTVNETVNIEAGEAAVRAQKRLG